MKKKKYNMKLLNRQYRVKKNKAQADQKTLRAPTTQRRGSTQDGGLTAKQQKPGWSSKRDWIRQYRGGNPVLSVNKIFNILCLKCVFRAKIIEISME